MPTEIKVIIEDNALPTVQASLDELNDFLRRATQPELTMDQFIQKTVVDRFDISQESIAARALEAQRQAIIAKIAGAKPDSLKAIADAIDAVLTTP